MRLDSLRVFHLPKSAVQKTDFDMAGFDAKGFIADAFLLVSCQRWVWVTTEAAVTRQSPRFESLGFLQNQLESFAGTNGYLFLLKIATGLESQIVGETDIFGQVKEAWFKADSAPAEMRTELGPWMQRLFEDTKEIRAQHLQNIGGASYGSLVRKIIQGKQTPNSGLRRADSNPTGSVLLVGAGQIARSVAPYLTDYELLVWNRSKENLELLKKELGPEATIRVIETAEEKQQAWKSASHVVVCVPVDSERDNQRLRLWNENENRGTVIHLGGYTEQCGEWGSHAEFHALDHVFALQKAQGEIRSVQIARARRACEERAKLRGMGNSITLPHGWEDLAAFA